MPQSGAQILYNTVELQQGFMKWAIACALTMDCMFPNYELSEVRIKFGTRYNPSNPSNWKTKFTSKKMTTQQIKSIRGSSDKIKKQNDKLIRRKTDKID